MTLCRESGMLKKLKARRRRAKVKKFVKDHGSQIIIGAAVGVATDVLTSVALDKLEKKFGRKFRV